MSDKGTGSLDIEEDMLVTKEKYRMNCYLPENGKAEQVVYLHTASPEASAVWELTGRDYALVSIEGLDWNRDLSPWPHEKVFTGGEDFAGGAEDYLKTLTGQIIPAVEQELLLTPQKRYLAGYSLGALFAVYAIYHTALFDGIGSVSGSLWYSGFSAYVKEHTVRRNPDKIYFSLGDKEAASARGIMQTVLMRTEEIEKKFQKDGIRTILEMNRGNHFKQTSERLAKGIRWLLL